MKVRPNKYFKKVISDHSKPVHLDGLLKVQKYGIPLRTESSTSLPFYILEMYLSDRSKFTAKIIYSHPESWYTWLHIPVN